MMPTKSEINKAINDLRDAKLMVYTAQSQLEQIAWDLMDMPVGDALNFNLIRFNFPTSPGFKRALREKTQNR